MHKIHFFILSEKHNLISNLINFVSFLYTKNIRYVSIIGLWLLMIIVVQCVTGVMISFSLVSEPMLIPLSRDEEDSDDLYTDDFFWLHERGVDYIFILLVSHFLRKLFLLSFSKRQELAWKSGSFLFLVIHGVIFFGLVLCCTHLSDITLTIAANIINTITFKIGKFYWFLFTDQTLNVDTIIRSMYLHYVLGLLTIVFGVLHALVMHYDYRDNNFFDGIDFEVEWFDIIFKNEIFKLADFFLIFVIVSNFMYSNIEPLSFEIFMWGDIGITSDVRFLGVAPHWYFRSYMGWLLLCPHHYLGVYGLIYLMAVVYFQPNIKNRSTYFFKNTNLILVKPELSFLHIFIFSIFLLSLLYADSFLPYGRFFNMVGGNIGLLIAYFIVFIYMSSNIYKYVYLFFIKMA